MLAGWHAYLKGHHQAKAPQCMNRHEMSRLRASPPACKNVTAANAPNLAVLASVQPVNLCHCPADAPVQRRHGPVLGQLVQEGDHLRQRSGFEN